MTPIPCAFLVFALFAVGGCASSQVSFDAYEGAAKSDAEIAVVAERNPKAALQSISRGGAMVWQRKANYGEQAVRGNITTEQVKLSPGRYSIESLLWCASTYAYGMSGYASPNFPGIRHIFIVRKGQPGNSFQRMVIMRVFGQHIQVTLIRFAVAVGLSVKITDVRQPSSACRSRCTTSGCLSARLA
jgi:hypothetical protein